MKDRNLLDKELLNFVKKDDKKAFSTLFNFYYKDLVFFGNTIISEFDTCEDIVQNIFLDIWISRYDLNIETSFKSYLLSAVRNRCIEIIRHRKVITKHQENILANDILEYSNTEDYILYSDLNNHLKSALEKMPPKLRECFEMNRFQNLKYKEIADTLNVSVRTVEVRISQSLILLRRYLKEFYYILIILSNINMW